MGETIDMCVIHTANRAGGESFLLKSYYTAMRHAKTYPPGIEVTYWIVQGTKYFRIDGRCHNPPVAIATEDVPMRVTELLPADLAYDKRVEELAKMIQARADANEVMVLPPDAAWEVLKVGK